MLRSLKFPIAAKAKDAALRYDVVIVGSGLSGCVAAKRLLDKRPEAKVAIVEEGSLPVSGLIAESPFFSSYISKLPWTRGMCAPYGAKHGRVVGGSCAVSEGPWVVRGLQSEYEAIAIQYGSNAIRKFDTYFEEVMAKAVPANRWGVTARDEEKIPVTYPTLRQLNSDINAKFQQACFAASLKAVSEENGDCDGFAPIRALAPQGKRFTPTDIIKNRNIDLYTETHVKALAFDKEGRAGRVNGVRVTPAGSKGNSAPVTIHADQVLLCAGGVGTPSLLLRSGFGPMELLGGHLKCRQDMPSLGQSVIEAPQFRVSFGTRIKGLTRTVGMHPNGLGTLYRSWREYKESREGPFASYAEWQAFVCSKDTVHQPDTRLTLITALNSGLPVLGDQEGFTMSIDYTATRERGKIIPIAKDEVTSTPNEDKEVQYQYSYCSEDTLKSMDDAVLWSTMLCDASSNITYFVNNAHPFAEYDTRALHPELEAPETSRELIRATVVGSGDVYGACPMGEVCDPNTLKLKGYENVSLGDVSVIPIPMMANKFALGQVTACMAVDGLA